MCIFFMRRRPPRSKRTDTLFPYTTLFRSEFRVLAASGAVDWAIDDAIHLNLAGHWSKNLAYDETKILARGFNASSGLSQIVSNNETCSVALVGGLCPAGKNVFKSGEIGRASGGESVCQYV